MIRSRNRIKTIKKEEEKESLFIDRYISSTRMCGRSNYTPNLVCKLPLLLLLISSARLPVMQPAPFPRPAHPNLYKKRR